MVKEYLNYSRASDVKDPYERVLYRFLEMVPGLLAWLTLGAVVVLSFIIPVWMAIFIITFNVYWLLKTIYLSTHLRISFNRVRRNMDVNWFERLQKIQPEQITVPNVFRWQDVRHLVFLPTYKEEEAVIASTLNGLKNTEYSKEALIVVLAQEQRAGREHNDRIRSFVESQFGNVFGRLVFVEHPGDIVGELAGKGSNIAWAGKYVDREIMPELGQPAEAVLVSALDIDTVVYPQYFACLTATYLTTKDPLHASYQPVPFYLNNIWDAPAMARISAFSTTFWQTVKQEQPESMITYSSHSMPYTALRDVGFWQTNMVSEDSRIFWQCLLYYDGHYRVEPLYYPVSMDANLAESYWRTMLNVYKQQRRWGYGAENFPYFTFGFIKNKKMPFARRLHYFLVMLEGTWSWSTNAIMLFLLGWLPILAGGAAFNTTVLSFNLPYMTRFMMTFAMFGLITSAVTSSVVLPVRPERHGKLRHAFMFLQWLLFPVKSIAFGALPALEAQTRLMLGKYMGFWVTPKARK